MYKQKIQYKILGGIFNLIGFLILFFLYLFVVTNIAFAQEELKIYSSSADGNLRVNGSGQTFEQVRNATNATFYDYVSTEIYPGLMCGKSGTNYRISRVFLFFTLPELEEGQYISNASVFLYTTDNANGLLENYVVTGHHSQYTNKLVSADYSKIDFTPVLSVETDIPDDNSYKEFVLNDDGLDYLTPNSINKLAITSIRDVENNAPTDYYYSGYVRFAGYAGTDYDPYLLLTISDEPSGGGSVEQVVAITQDATVNTSIVLASIIGLIGFLAVVIILAV